MNLVETSAAAGHFGVTGGKQEEGEKEENLAISFMQRQFEKE